MLELVTPGRSASRACTSPTAHTRRSAAIDFEIAAGEVFGLLGPNGAGKTTTVEILEGYRTRDAGTVTVLGEDPQRAGLDWRQRIGVVLQSSAMYPNLTVAESLELFAGYYERPRDVGEVIELVGLGEKRDARVRTLSGGQQRRLDLGLGLVGDPEVLFLDEPTTGFDPAARRAAWEVIRSLRTLGKTILLTTHYLDEAEQLSDRVAVLREGTIVAIGRPAELAGRGAGDRDPLPPRRRGGRRLHTRADARPPRADRAGARRGPRARGPDRSPADARGGLPRADRGDAASEALRPPAARRAAPVLAQPRARVLHLPLPARCSSSCSTRSTATR